MDSIEKITLERDEAFRQIGALQVQSAQLAQQLENEKHEHWLTVKELDIALEQLRQTESNYLEVARTLGVYYGVWGRHDTPGPLEAILSHIRELQQSRNLMEDYLSNLLARIHGDGGHRVLEVGLHEAVEEADEKIVALCHLVAPDNADAIRQAWRERDEAFLLLRDNQRQPLSEDPHDI